MNPLVSVVVPVRNGAQFLPACLDSIFAQTYEHIEVVVADNASVDATPRILSAYRDSRLRLLAQPPEPLGLHTNWERAIRVTTGRYLKIVCHDDLLLPDCIGRQVELLENNPQAILAGSRRRIIDDRGRIIMASRGLGRMTASTATAIRSREEIAVACIRAGTNLLGEPAAVLFRRDAIPTPILDDRWQFALDIDLYMRCLQGGPAVLDRSVEACFRVSRTQLSATLAPHQSDELWRYLMNLRRDSRLKIGQLTQYVGRMRCSTQAWARRLVYAQLTLRDALYHYFPEVDRATSSATQTEATRQNWADMDPRS